MDQPTDKPIRRRSCTLINRAHAKEFALQVASRAHPYQKFGRVSDGFLDEFTEECERLLAAKVKRHPSKGKTLMPSFPRSNEEKD